MIKHLINILELTTTYPIDEASAATRGVVNLTRALKDDFQITVLLPQSCRSQYPKYQRYENIEIYRFQYFFSKYQYIGGDGGILYNIKRNKVIFFQLPLFLISQFIAAFRIVRKRHIHIIHANWMFPQGLTAYLLFLITRKPYIVTIRGADIYSISLSLYRWLMRKVLHSAKKIVVTSQHLASDVEKIFGFSQEKISVIPSGIDTTFFQYREGAVEKIKRKHHIDNKSILLFAGRLVPEKGVDFLLRSLEKLVRENPRVFLLLVGSGPMKNDLELLTKRLGINNFVSFVGNISQDEMVDYYSACDIFILPSRKEGTPSTLLEAMSVGKPVVVCNFSGAGEYGGAHLIVKNHTNGVVIQRDDVKGFCQAVGILLNSKNLRKKIGENAKKSVKRFDYRFFAEEYKKLFHLIFKEYNHKTFRRLNEI